jgi:peptidoglycan/xylan/chitin deacetylase (PgdA/CDA1 family)
MEKNKSVPCSRFRAIAANVMILLTVLLAGCAGNSGSPDTPVINPTALFEQALLTATYAVVMPTATLQPTATPLPPSPTPNPTPANRTPPALPDVFHTSSLRQGVTPQTYIKDTCQYLKDRWDANNSAPGTVVMPIMFHSITDGKVTENTQITHDQLVQLLRDMKAQGFQTITTEQLANFLEHNASIPKRSMILIVDDRHNAIYFQTHFLPFLEENHGTVTNAWISTPNSTQDLIDGMAALIKAGWVDVQAHGVIHNAPIDPGSSEDFIHSELYGSISWIEEHFGKHPIAYIWPTGSFTKRGVEVARQAGYRLGFTVNPRGPLMYNWIPQADSNDQPFAEGPAADPLMTLPRYWDTDAVIHIDEVRTISKQAEAYAKQDKQTELDYYDIVCKSITGEIPTKAP